MDAALARIKADTTLIAIDSDYLFPARQMEAIVPKIPGARIHTIPSDFGHDGFLLESARLREIIAPLLD